MPLTKEEVRVLINFDRDIIPNEKERLRKELFHLLRTSVDVYEAAQRLSYIDIDKRLSDLLQIKLDRIVDAHLHRAFEDYFKLLQEMEKKNG